MKPPYRLFVLSHVDGFDASLIDPLSDYIGSTYRYLGFSSIITGRNQVHDAHHACHQEALQNYIELSGR